MSTDQYARWAWWSHGWGRSLHVWDVIIYGKISSEAGAGSRWCSTIHDCAVKQKVTDPRPSYAGRFSCSSFKLSKWANTWYHCRVKPIQRVAPRPKETAVERIGESWAYWRQIEQEDSLRRENWAPALLRSFSMRNQVQRFWLPT